jgi:lipoprotein-releasing system permease protein
VNRSWLPFEWIVALRFLREGRVQTAAIIGGVALGVAVIVFMSALMTGLQEMMINRVLTGQAHIQLTEPKEVVRPLRTPDGSELAIVQAPLQRLKGIDQWQGVVAQLQAMPEVVVISPAVSGPAVIVRGAATRVVSLTGIEPDLYYQIVTLPSKIVSGTAALSGSDLIIGTELASDLTIALGDKLTVTGSSGASSLLSVVGIVDLGNKSANQRNVFMAMRTAQTLTGLPGGATAIDVSVRDLWNAEVIARQIAGAANVQADSWIATNAQFFTAVSAQSAANNSISLFVGLSVAFGIASVLVVSVVQKSREIGILRAMGITRGQILRVFLLQGGLLGLGGSIVGSGLGMIGLAAWSRLQQASDGSALYHLVFSGALFVSALTLATITGLLAAFAPAMHAARLDPVVAINA